MPARQSAGDPIPRREETEDAATTNEPWLHTLPVGASRFELASGRRLHLLINPPSDDRFRAFVGATFAAVGEDVRRFEDRLRTRYPRAVIHPRSLADEPWLVWYVYREGHWVREPGS
jgi:hypothetical protein